MSADRDTTRPHGHHLALVDHYEPAVLVATTRRFNASHILQSGRVSVSHSPRKVIFYSLSPVLVIVPLSHHFSREKTAPRA